MIPLHLKTASATIFEQLDGLFLAGGEDIALHQSRQSTQMLDNQPIFDRDATELTLTRWALAAGLPILGICRGMQLINVACGGRSIMT